MRGGLLSIFGNLLIFCLAFSEVEGFKGEKFIMREGALEECPLTKKRGFNPLLKKDA